jgi:hypothetical protein
MALQRLGGRRRRLLAPQRLDQPIRAHRLSRVQQQRRRHRPPLRTDQIDPAALVSDLQRSQDLELDHLDLASASLPARPVTASPTAVTGLATSRYRVRGD